MQIFQFYLRVNTWSIVSTLIYRIDAIHSTRISRISDWYTIIYSIIMISNSLTLKSFVYIFIQRARRSKACRPTRNAPLWSCLPGAWRFTIDHTGRMHAVITSANLVGLFWFFKLPATTLWNIFSRYSPSEHQGNWPPSLKPLMMAAMYVWRRKYAAEKTSVFGN
jgi:hypothetical protein